MTTLTKSTLKQASRTPKKVRVNAELEAFFVPFTYGRFVEYQTRLRTQEAAGETEQNSVDLFVEMIAESLVNEEGVAEFTAADLRTDCSFALIQELLRAVMTANGATEEVVRDSETSFRRES